jgi:superfamily II DNA/RNA helicase
MKLLVFTEHKDTLDYLAGDGKDGRPLGKLREWGLTVTQIHGGMKIGDRDTPGTASTPNASSGSCQVLVATEAAGEGINLQFCWLMINFDIPGTPSAWSSASAASTATARRRTAWSSTSSPRTPAKAACCRSCSTGWRRSATTWAPTRSSTSWARSSRRTCSKSCSARCTPGRPTSTDQDRIVRDVSPERFRAITESA